MSDLQAPAPRRIRNAIRNAGDAPPSGLNPAQLGAWRRVVAARVVLADLEPLGADYLDGEAYFEQMRRINGADR